jgi:hypothetical protein
MNQDYKDFLTKCLTYRDGDDVPSTPYGVDKLATYLDDMLAGKTPFVTGAYQAHHMIDTGVLK